MEKLSTYNVSTYNRFGKKMKELIELVKVTKDWETYIEGSTVILINELLTMQNMGDIMAKHDFTYTKLRVKYLIALDRIKGKKKDRIRDGKSEKAKKLLDLIESNPNWKDCLTARQVKYANSFKEFKSFYEVGRQLNVNPSNVAGTLYGTNQRVGVLGKLQNLKG